MNNYNFKKEDFVATEDGRYSVEFDKDQVGNGIDLVIEEVIADGKFSTIQAEIKRFNDKIFVYWSTPFDGRIVSDIKY
ncbi:glutathione synthase [Chryseobacterium wangxinyae]|uniref:glutathione synthase n=1 Tax=Chryseobacterium sp. CY353 TaxID=2997334 RepID=UPI00226F8B98|nr:glutathione synthase [Chryseobacterium sp. CY353]MCY0970835.1 glutathione synthase [Chryseobacterium sp. CY353]